MMRPAAPRNRQPSARLKLLGSRGAQLLCCLAALLLLVSQVSPARQTPQKHRRLGEDTALSAALNGLPVSPSAGSGISGVNVYGLDSSLLAALQGNSSSSNSTSNSTQGPTLGPAPVPQPLNPGKPVQSQSLPVSPRSAPAQPAKPVKSQPISQTLNASSVATVALPPSPAMAPVGAAPPRGLVTPLDPLLAAALEGQGRVSAPAVALSHAPYGKTAPAMAPASTMSPAAAPLSEAYEQRASEPSSPLTEAQVCSPCMSHGAFSTP